MKKNGIKKVSLVNFLNILDIVNISIEKQMTILVRGWSQVDYLLEYSTNSNIFLFFILFGIFVDNKIKKQRFYQIGFSSENFDYA